MYNCSKSQAGLLTESRTRTQHFRISSEYPFYSASCVFFLRRSFLTEVSVLGCKTEGPPRDPWGMTEPWQKSKWVLPTIPSTPHPKNWQQRAVWPTPLFPWIISSFQNCFRGLTNNAGLWFWTSQAAEALGQETVDMRSDMSPGEGVERAVEESGNDPPSSQGQIYNYSTRGICPWRKWGDKVIILALWLSDLAMHRITCGAFKDHKA